MARFGLRLVVCLLLGGLVGRGVAGLTRAVPVTEPEIEAIDDDYLPPAEEADDGPGREC
jgi:hypothetical protein